jgi:hypothetical protein
MSKVWSILSKHNRAKLCPGIYYMVFCNAVNEKLLLGVCPCVSTHILKLDELIKESIKILSWFRYNFWQFKKETVEFISSATGNYDS